jgi:hypothetical protein
MSKKELRNGAFLITLYSLLITIYTLSMDNKRLLQIIVLILLVGLVWFLLPKIHQSQETPTANITDFGSCQMAGGEILQADPITCKMPDGRTFAEDPNPGPEVVLDSPQYGDLVKSPLTIVGKAKGSWFFEAQMPVILKDDKGNILFQGPAQAQSDWMTTDYVPFSATLKFDPKNAQYGLLIINKDNPSGDTALDSSFAIPVRFK